MFPLFLSVGRGFWGILWGNPVIERSIHWILRRAGGVLAGWFEILAWRDTIGRWGRGVLLGARLGILQIHAVGRRSGLIFGHPTQVRQAYEEPGLLPDRPGAASDGPWLASDAIGLQ